MTVSPDIQCKTCLGDGRPVKVIELDRTCHSCSFNVVQFDSISIMIETMSLSLSLISLTIAVLCMLNVKYVCYVYVKVFRFHPLDVTGPRHLSPRPAQTHFCVIPPNLPLLFKCFLVFRRLHLPRNLLHMHLFVAFIFRSIVKLAFIHLIVGGYTRSMISYSRDKCGNIEIISKSSNLLQVSRAIDAVVSVSLFIVDLWLSSIVLPVLVYGCRVSDLHLLRGDVSLHGID